MTQFGYSGECKDYIDERLEEDRMQREPEWFIGKYLIALWVIAIPLGFAIYWWLI